MCGPNCAHQVGSPAHWCAAQAHMHTYTNTTGQSIYACHTATANLDAYSRDQTSQQQDPACSPVSLRCHLTALQYRCSAGAPQSPGPGTLNPNCTPDWAVCALGASWHPGETQCRLSGAHVWYTTNPNPKLQTGPKNHSPKNLPSPQRQRQRLSLSGGFNGACRLCFWPCRLCC